MNELFNLATRFVVAVEGIASALSYPVPKKAADESNVVGETRVTEVPEVIKYLKHTLDSTDDKLIVFGYHRDVLKALSDDCLDKVALNWWREEV